jgi:[acyl-carrier-protein] S-malonyltransferase
VVERVCAEVSREGAVVVPANYNAPGQVVVSGDAAALAPVSEALKAAGAKRVLPLRVSGAFHSPLMEPAVQGLREGLRGIDFSAARFPVVSNVTTEPVAGGEQARELLLLQLTSPVCWGASVAAMAAAGVDRFFELGSGSVLCGLNRRNTPDATCTSLGTPADLDRILE